MRKILYIEDMEECHEFTKRALGHSYEVISAYTKQEAEKIIKDSIDKFDAVISDVNLVYDKSKPDNEQTKEGLELIAFARKESKGRGMRKLPIFCISTDGSNKKPSLKTGANIFMWKKTFWNGKGQEYLDKIISR